MIINIDVNVTIVICVATAGLANDQNGCGLPAAAVASGFITCFQRGVKFSASSSFVLSKALPIASSG
jgi:hypothetical protein